MTVALASTEATGLEIYLRLGPDGSLGRTQDVHEAELWENVEELARWIEGLPTALLARLEGRPLRAVRVHLDTDRAVDRVHLERAVAELTFRWPPKARPTTSSSRLARFEASAPAVDLLGEVA